MKTYLKIEKIIDPNRDPEGAAVQTSQPWCSVQHSGWIVTGTDSIEEAVAFVQAMKAAPISDAPQWGVAMSEGISLGWVAPYGGHDDDYLDGHYDTERDALDAMNEMLD